MTWIQLYNGEPYNFTAPDVNQIDWESIAVSLSRMPRFNGHTIVPYYGAQHCIEVAKQLEGVYRVYGLLHDAHEALTGGDFPSPIKKEIFKYTGFLDDIIKQADTIIYKKAGIAPLHETTQIAKVVHEADLRMYETEKRQIMRPCDKEWFTGHDPYDIKLKPMTQIECRTIWLGMLKQEGVF